MPDQAAHRGCDGSEHDDFTATAPNQLWGTNMRTGLVLDTLEMALWSRDHAGLTAG